MSVTADTPRERLEHEAGGRGRRGKAGGGEERVTGRQDPVVSQSPNKAGKPGHRVGDRLGGCRRLHHRSPNSKHPTGWQRQLGMV